MIYYFFSISEGYDEGVKYSKYLLTELLGQKSSFKNQLKSMLSEGYTIALITVYGFTDCPDNLKTTYIFYASFTMYTDIFNFACAYNSDKLWYNTYQSSTDVFYSWKKLYG